MPRKHDYLQTLIGDCGHVCQAWPQIGRLGRRDEVFVVCDVCTRLKWSIPDEEHVGVWVRAKTTSDQDEEKPVKKTMPRKRATKKVAKPSIWQQLMMDDDNGG